MTPRDTWLAVGRWALDDGFAEELKKDPEATLEAAGYELDPIESKTVVETTARLAEYPPDHWTALGRAVFDRQFGERLASSPELTVEGAGYRVSPEELEAITDARARYLKQTPEAWLAAGRVMLQMLGKHQREGNLSREARWSVDVVKHALDNAARTHRLMTWMNKILFGVGVALFVGAAAYGIAAQGELALVLAGLGVVSFGTLFLVGPFERSQNALSRLVQVEISFMNYTEQIAMWEEYSMRDGAVGGKEGADAIRRASAELQRRSAETVEMLQRYTEGPARGIRNLGAASQGNGSAPNGRTAPDRTEDGTAPSPAH